MSIRDPWADLASELEAAAAFARSRGADIEQRLYEWQKIEKIPRTPAPCPDCDGDGCEECHGSGNAPSVGSGDGTEDRMASRHLHRYRVVIADLATRLQVFRSFEAVAFPKVPGRLEPRHLSVVQVEADGGCGSCWRVGVFWYVETRPSGEPFYRGRCRFCGAWPEGDPPLDAVRTKRGGLTERRARAAS